MDLLFKNNIPLSQYCTFGIGGPARFFVEIYSINEMQETLRHCAQKQIPFFILGKGSNCVFDDRGFQGLVILNKIDFIHYLEDGLVHVGGGYSFSLLGTQTARKGFSGLEFASGIPGTVGGAIFMNAGANGGETFDNLISVEYVTENGDKIELKKEQLQFSYRFSCFQNMRGAIVGAQFALKPAAEAREKQLEIISYRKKTQPYSDMSAGCVFRNPVGGHAGAIIDKCGLKGFRIGDAQVSEKHANFVVNIEKATAQEVKDLINFIQKSVKEKMGIELEVEVRFIK